jgi:cardiolipin synthase A/B
LKIRFGTKRLAWVYVSLTLGWAIFGSTASEAFPVEVAEAPQNDLSLTLKAIDSARHSLAVNIYELSSQDITDALVRKINEGIKVEILEEGQPVGSYSAEQIGRQHELVQAMQKSGNDSDQFYLMRKRSQGRRFHFDHAKYIVVDQKALLIGSENYSASGNPEDGNRGNRGWEVLLHDGNIASQFNALFEKDTDPSFGDLEELARRTKAALLSLLPELSLPSKMVQSADESLPTYEAESVQMITSPDTSLDGLVAMIDGATSTLDLEMMTFSPKWGSTGKESPLLTAVMNAARRGVNIRVLLNDESVFDHQPADSPKHKNRQTIHLLNQLAEDEDLKVEGRIADLYKMGVSYIHNKGMLADSDQTLISSINWNQNSVENNREAAVILKSEPVHGHYRALFDSDWTVSRGGRKISRTQDVMQDLAFR